MLANRFLCHKNSNLRPGGFTLLEILLCLVIIGILTAFAVPAYTSILENRALVATAEAIAADLRWARSEALKRNLDVSVTFTPGDNWNYNISIPPNTSIKTVANAINPDFERISLSENFRKDSTTFSSLRGSSEGKNGTLELVGNHGNSILHVVLSNLGRVHICHFKGQIGDYTPCA